MIINFYAILKWVDSMMVKFHALMAFGVVKNLCKISFVQVKLQAKGDD